MINKKGCEIIKIVVGGCRDFNDYQTVKQYLDYVLQRIRSESITILSGHCRGVDLLSEKYARENGFDIELHPAKWNEYGKSAGPRRNLEMVINADYVIAFWDGKSKGTYSLISLAKSYNKPLRVKKI